MFLTRIEGDDWKVTNDEVAKTVLTLEGVEVIEVVRIDSEVHQKAVAYDELLERYGDLCSLADAVRSDPHSGRACEEYDEFRNQPPPDFRVTKREDGVTVISPTVPS